MADDPHHRADRAGRDRRERAARRRNLFDIRRLIGGLFLIYGVILDRARARRVRRVIAKSAGININLYAGLGDAHHRRAASSPGRCGGRSAQERARPSQSRRAAGPGATATAPSGRGQPGGSSASTAPPKPPPIMRAPAAPAALSALDGRLDLGHRRLVVVAQARVRGVEQARRPRSRSPARSASTVASTRAFSLSTWRARRPSGSARRSAASGSASLRCSTPSALAAARALRAALVVARGGVRVRGARVER